MDNTEGNILRFPESKIVRHKNPLEDHKLVEVSKATFIDNMVAQLTEAHIKFMITVGVDITTEDFKKDYVVIIECIRSLLYRNAGIDHPLQQPLTVLYDEIKKRV